MYLLPTTAEPPAWSTAARSLSMLVCAEAAFAVLVLANGAPGHRLALGAGLAAVVTLPLIVRARMPMAAKTLLAIAALTATLTVAASADLMGLRSVESAIADAPIADGPARIVTVAPGATRAARPAYLTVSGNGDPVADRLADDLARTMRAAEPGGQDVPQIDGAVTHDASGFALRWAVARGGQRRRCGTLRIFGSQQDLAVTAFRDAVTGAIAASRAGPLACYAGADTA